MEYGRTEKLSFCRPSGRTNKIVRPFFCKGSRASPTKRVAWEEEAQESDVSFPLMRERKHSGLCADERAPQ